MANSMRKSKPPAIEPNGNAAKYLSYREAWARVAAAKQNGFHIEAVTILEGIISDRLLAYLLAVGEIDARERGNFPKLYRLIKTWSRKHPEPIAIGKFSNLQESIDSWRVCRNRAIHEIVRVEDGANIMRIDEYLIAAEQASDEGEALAKALSHWCRKAVRNASQEPDCR